MPVQVTWSHRCNIDPFNIGMERREKPDKLFLVGGLETRSIVERMFGLILSVCAYHGKVSIFAAIFISKL